jgi:hypothetical protein
MIHYHHTELSILLSTASPAATHELLLKGMNALLRYYALSSEKRPADADGIAAILELQQCMEPDEKGLQKAYT